jgi:hypothetical protein
MAKTFKVGDHVSWNLEAGRVRAKIVAVVSSSSRRRMPDWESTQSRRSRAEAPRRPPGMPAFLLSADRKTR